MPVLDEQVVIDGPAGTYQFGIVIDHGAAPAGGRTTFYVSDSKIDAVLPGAVTIWEDDVRLATWLQARHVAAVPFDGALPIPDASVILVGSLPLTGMDPARWQVLERLMDRGSTVIFISPDAFLRGEDTTGWLPLVNKGRCDIFYNSIYHREDVAKNHPIFAGLPAGGIMDWAYYRDIIPQRIFQDQDTPDETIVAGFAVGYTCPTGYTSGVSLGVYRFGAGRFVVNTLRVLENMGRHPVADRLLANMIAWAGG